jgi:hypothetical protein
MWDRKEFLAATFQGLESHLWPILVRDSKPLLRENQQLVTDELFVR